MLKSYKRELNDLYITYFKNTVILKVDNNIDSCHKVYLQVYMHVYRSPGWTLNQYNIFSVSDMLCNEALNLADQPPPLIRYGNYII